jgi:hypothetical protein
MRSMHRTSANGIRMPAARHSHGTGRVQGQNTWSPRLSRAALPNWQIKLHWMRSGA